MNTQEAAQAVAYMIAAYPRQQIPKETAAVFARELAELPVELVMAALQDHIRTSKYPPTIAEIRAIATRDAGMPTALEAWMEVEQTYTPYGSPEMFSHLAIGQTFVAVFGSNRFGENAWLPKFDEWTRKAFLEAYGSVAGRHDRDLALGQAGGAVGELMRGLADRKRLGPGRTE